MRIAPFTRITACASPGTPTIETDLALIEKPE
jgi:hypothetical protein